MCGVWAAGSWVILQTWLITTPDSPVCPGVSDLKPDQGDCEGLMKRGGFGLKHHTLAVRESSHQQRSLGAFMRSVENWTVCTSPTPRVAAECRGFTGTLGKSVFYGFSFLICAVKWGQVLK